MTSSLNPSIWQHAILTLTDASSTPLDGPLGSPVNNDNLCFYFFGGDWVDWWRNVHGGEQGSMVNNERDCVIFVELVSIVSIFF